VFLADTVYCMSRSPGRFVVQRHIDLPRPRDLEVTYTPHFTDIVHELRGHIGAMRNNDTEIVLLDSVASSMLELIDGGADALARAKSAFAAAAAVVRELSP
jgi:hypothetical protein